MIWFNTDLYHQPNLKKATSHFNIDPGNPFQQLVGRKHRLIVGEAHGSAGRPHRRTHIDFAETAALDAKVGSKVAAHPLQHYQDC